jgi:thioredoxin reductase
VLVRNTGVLRNPSAAQVARELGLRAEVDGERFDAVVLGAGPAGLASAVYAGSEGLRTLVVEAWAPGGQAGTSTRIENYLGFPAGVSGTELTRKATLQAQRFDAIISSHHRVVELADGHEGLVRVDLDDGQHVLARTVVVATGARWRTLEAEGIARFTGAGVYHAASATDAERCRGEDVIIVGGGNSAGQAAVHLSRAARSVRVVVRRDGLSATMSRYLVDRIEHRSNIDVVTETEVAAVHGNGRLESVDLRDRRDGSTERIDVSALFVMIGADPCTEAVHTVLGVDPAGYLVCGTGAACHEGPLPLAAWKRARAPAARDGQAWRVRRGRRARGRVQARGLGGGRRRAGRAARASGAAELSARRRTVRASAPPRAGHLRGRPAARRRQWRPSCAAHCFAPSSLCSRSPPSRAPKAPFMSPVPAPSKSASTCASPRTGSSRTRRSP